MIDSKPQATDRPKLTRQELAIHLRVSQRYVDKLIANNAIPVIRMGRRCVRFDLHRVEEALEKLEVKAA